MSVLQIMSFIIISSVFLHTHSADDIYSAVIPQTVTALTGSCVTDSPEPPELKPSELWYMKEGTTVNLSCSAEAPCPEKPATISWSNLSESANITTQLQEKPDKTLSVFPYMTFKASYKDHRKNITCSVTYTRNTSDASTVKSTMKLKVLFSSKETHITIDSSDSVSGGTNVTLTCRSKASPSNNLSYTWYKHGQKMPITRGKKVNFILNHNNTGLYFCRAQNKYGNQSSTEIQLTAEGIPHDTGEGGHSMTVIAGCVGGIVAVLMLSAIGFCTRMRKKRHRRDNDCQNQVHSTDNDYVNISSIMINEHNF